MHAATQTWDDICWRECTGKVVSASRFLWTLYLGVLAEGGQELRVGASGQDVVELGLISSQFLLPSTVQLLSLSGGLSHVHCCVLLTGTLGSGENREGRY